METARLDLNLINSQVLSIVFIFSIFSGFRDSVAPNIGRFLDALNYTTLEIGLIINLSSVIIFFPVFILLFVLLYQTCKHNFIENIAGIIVSLIVGTVVGYWIGGLVGAVLSGYVISPSIFLYGNLLIEFAACSAAYIATKWRISTPNPQIVSERPVGVTLIAGFYVFLGVLLSFLSTFLFLSSYVSFEVFLLKPLILTELILLLGIASIIHFFIAHGFYKHRRWGWLVIFASTLMGIFLSINEIIFRFSLDAWLIIKILMLLLSIFIFIYILQPSIRIYFGIINPQSEKKEEGGSDLQG
ncbi:hypothetical protein HXY33_02845 [Candidatus Bathyarchaeota archaeon]|nr:hypothetical protein [Candidatus Bathyarchaeota archaeon]